MFKFVTPQGNHLRGRLALQADQHKPFVILVCGLLCEGTESGLIQSLFSHFYEEAQFHVLILESISSEAYSIRNSQAVFGGFSEGQELYHLGRWLKLESSFRSKINSLHLVGSGLGGQSVLYAGLYNDSNPLNDELKAFDSVIAHHPVIDLKKYVEQIFQTFPLSQFSRPLGQKFLDRLQNRVPKIVELQQRIGFLNNPSFFMGELISANLSHANSSQFLLPFRFSGVHDQNTFWDRNDFKNFSRGFKTPTLILASEDDPFINFQDQVGALKVQHQEKSGSLQIVSLKNGGHATWTQSLGWASHFRILRSYIQSHSYDFVIKREKHRLAWNFAHLPIQSGDRIYSYQWSAEEGHTQAKLKIKILRSSLDSCRINLSPDGSRNSLQNEKNLPQDCFLEQTEHIPLSEIGKSIALSPFDAEALTKNLNANWEVHGKRGHLIETNQQATHFRFW